MRRLLLPIVIIAVIAITFGSLSMVENLVTKSHAGPFITEVDVSVCEYLANNIIRAMDLANSYTGKQGSMRHSLIAANYLKLYELCKCHEHYLKLSVGAHGLSNKLQRKLK